MDKESKKTKLYEFDENQLLRLRKIIAVGDLHGDYDTLNSLLVKVDLTKDCVIFLGDYADRGPNGVEVIDVINSLMKKNPLNVITLKGNHEDFTDSGMPTFSPCDLIQEVRWKKGDWQTYFKNYFKPFVEKLYLATIIPNEVLFVHGGISSKIRSLDDLRHPTREVEIDVLWSDPFEGNGQHPNRRGVGVEFGKDITESICERLGIKRIIRSHEPRKAISGPYYEHDDKIITTSCSRVYGGKPFILIKKPSDPSKISHRFL